ncbi:MULTISPECIES: alanine dehydrogenase [unclassified Algibacter]|uniref:alanine dehydrogenase n=1 Tax=unclassified Algibacter TaxID=2615009 RepID=UPI00131D4D24|nr:alanine dehydrogenase [Algibacter sp. L3A6]
MKIGVPIEIKNSENRVGMIPSGVFELTKRNHEVYVQTNAGFNSGFLDEEYIEAGATILDSIEAVYEIADMIVKVKEPIEAEYELIREDQVVFTYFHFASSEPLTMAMIKSKSICIAYETVEDNDGSLPLLIPMSEVAGRMSVQQGAKFLEKPIKGRGILLGGIPGVPPAKVLILGAGIVGYQAAKMASGLGAQVTIMDINMKALRYVSDSMPNNVISEFSSEYNIRKHIVDADLIIGGVLLKGAKAPKLITRDMLKEMRPGTVMVDVAVDQGGCFETTHPTTHQDPTYIIDEVVHYTVANMPGAVPYTSTMGLTNVTLPYVIKLANEGWEQACQNSAPLARGLNIIKGKIVYKEIAEAFDMSLETA